MKLGRVVIIHGANFTDADKSKFRMLARGFIANNFEVVIPSYGFLPAVLIGLFSFIDNRIANTISSFVHEDDILVGHSNGGTLAYLISKKIKVRGVILINPALEPDLVPNADFVHVYFTPDDVPTRLSAIVPFSIWGNMGAKGYLGTDARVRNIDESNPPLRTLPPLHGHSEIFEPANIRPWANYISGLALESIKPDIGELS